MTHSLRLFEMPADRSYLGGYFNNIVYQILFKNSAAMKNIEQFNDQELLTLLQTEAGGQFAFSQICLRYWHKLHLIGCRQLGNAQVAEEIVQDVFVNLWQKRNTQRIQLLPAYLYSCIRYQVYGSYKKSKRATFSELTESMCMVDTEEADSGFKKKELHQCIMHWLKHQPEKRAEIFRLKYTEDLSTREIGEKLNISQKTVQNQMLTSSNSLKAYLTKIKIVPAC